MTNLREGKIPEFNEMESDNVYYSLNPTFPAFDIYYKPNKKLVCIQVTWQNTKELSKSAFDTFFNKKLDIKQENIIIVLCPHPTKANTAKLNLILF